MQLGMRVRSLKAGTLLKAIITSLIVASELFE